MAREKIRIGVLGAAKIAPNAIILPAAKRDDVEIRAVAARDRGRAEAYAAHHGIPVVADDYADLVAREDLDLIYVALPPAGHMEWSIRALEAGKAVLCEKPLALNQAEAAEMVEAGRRTGRPLIEAFHYRHHPLMLRLTELVRSGRLGKIHRLRAAFDVTIPFEPGELRWIRDQGGGAVMDLGCYPIHAFRHLLGGEPVVRDARCVLERGVDASTTAWLQFPNDVAAELRCSMVASPLDISLEIEGERGRARTSNFVVPHYGADLQVTIDGETETTRLASEPTTYEAQLAHVVDVLSGRAQPITAGTDSIANMAAIQAVRAVAETEVA
jgi:predicted dehydrogenase